MGYSLTHQKVLTKLYTVISMSSVFFCDQLLGMEKMDPLTY